MDSVGDYHSDFVSSLDIGLPVLVLLGVVPRRPCRCLVVVVPVVVRLLLLVVLVVVVVVLDGDDDDVVGVRSMVMVPKNDERCCASCWG